MHGGIGTAHTNTGGACAAAGCHTGDLAAVHTSATTTTPDGTRTGCLVCHASSALPASGVCADCHGDNMSGNLQSPRPSATGYRTMRARPLTEAVHSAHARFIRMPDKEIVISNAQVAIMDAHGVRSFQISGDVSERPASSSPAGSAVQEEPAPEIPDSDVELVAGQTGAKAEDARAALVEAKGDLAAAIMKLSSK